MPIEKGKVIEAIFVRRKKTKSGTMKFYLYDENDNSLFLSSDVNSTVSLSSNDFNRDGMFFCGTFVKDDNNSYGYSHHHNLEANIQKKSVNIEDTYFEVSTITLRDGQILHQKVPKRISGTWVLSFPRIGQESIKNLILLSDEENTSLVFEKIHEDEFYMSICYPLSIFQAFCIALSRMY